MIVDVTVSVPHGTRSYMAVYPSDLCRCLCDIANADPEFARISPTGIWSERYAAIESHVFEGEQDSNGNYGRRQNDPDGQNECGAFTLAHPLRYPTWQLRRWLGCAVIGFAFGNIGLIVWIFAHCF